MSATVVSIIIPNYNKGKFVSETLKSAINQSFVDLEVIVVDDGSTDDSIEVIGEFCKEYENIKLIERNRQPKGGSTCRNIGLDNSKGEFIMFLDSDDLITTSCITDRLKYIKQEQSDFVVFNTGTFNREIGDNNFTWKVPKSNHLELFLRHDLPWNISSVFWTKKALIKLNGFQENFVRLQDVELHTRALLSNLKYSVSRNTSMDFYYRINPNRNLLSKETALLNKLRGLSKYISYFETNVTSKRKYLKGTAISAYKEILYFYNGKEIENRLIKAVLGKIFASNTKMENAILTLYSKLFSLGFHKIKGFNFLFKKAFIYL